MVPFHSPNASCILNFRHLNIHKAEEYSSGENEDVKKRTDTILLTYATLIAVVSVAGFLHGFFPIKYHDNERARVVDIPEHVRHVKVKAKDLYKPMAKKVVIMVIDALRWDFITGPVGSASMPVTTRLISQNSSCLMQAKCETPTVTMPRIKALMTGGVPSFIDVALNFGDLPVTEDSVLLQAKKNHHVIHFYGDDTWLKIFPGMFDRFEGTTSFYVNDFTEVDHNVTRNVGKELENNGNWSILILHYLGLDHIGHVTGPFSPLVEPKLREMDLVVDRIQKKIQYWNEHGLPAIFVISGDHGMKDSGGHGGSTPQETLVPFFVLGANCPTKIDPPNRIRQVDVAAILSMVIGTPIPISNIGSVPLFMLEDRSDSSKLFVLYYNAQQVLKHFKAIPNYESTSAYKYYKDAVELHIDWLVNQRESHSVETALNLYDEALQNMKDLLIRSTTDYDLHTMTISMIFMAHILYIMANGESYTIRGGARKIYWAIGSIGSYFILRFIWTPGNVALPKNSPTNIPFHTIVFVILLANSYIAGNLSFRESFGKRIANLEFRECLLTLGMFAHSMSLSSSSFVEEEHQTWYFFWATLFILLFFESLRENWSARLKIEIFAILAIHRILRKLNSTGNKYADAPDIADWLRNEENQFFMTLFLLVALCLLLWIGYVCEEKKYRVTTSILHAGAAICIYLRHATNKSVAEIPFYFSSRGIIEIRIFWIIVMLYIIHWTNRLFRRTEKRHFSKSFLRFIVQSWIIISSVLHRPHNVILLPMQILASRIIHAVSEKAESGNYCVLYIFICMGNVFYFYQGNSNSLATIDVAAGYVGMESYRPFITAIFLSINTYAAPVLAYLLLLYRSSFSESPNSRPENLSINRNFVLWRLLPFTIYTFIVITQRFHLFVWSVFSPKLLYESMHCAVIFTIILATEIFSFFRHPK